MAGDRGQGRASIAIGALAGVAVVAGLALGGGPLHARKERRDAARVEDLGGLAAHIGCLADGAQQLPASLAATDACPGPVPTNDRFTGAPYRVEPIGAGRYRLCAGFELPPPAGRPDQRSGDCLVETLPRNPPDAAPLADGSGPAETLPAAGVRD